MVSGKRIAIFIDGANLNLGQARYAASQKGYKMDPAKLIDRLTSGRRLVAVNYYASSLVKRGHKPSTFSKIEQAFNIKFHFYEFETQVDVGLAVDMLDEAWRGAYDIAVLVSGDQDFLPAVAKIRSVGKEVEVACFENGLATSLRRGASSSVILDLHADYIRVK